MEQKKENLKRRGENHLHIMRPHRGLKKPENTHFKKLESENQLFDYLLQLYTNV